MTVAASESLAYRLHRGRIRPRHLSLPVAKARGKGTGFHWEIWVTELGSVVHLAAGRTRLVDLLLPSGTLPPLDDPVEAAPLVEIRDILTVETPRFIYNFFWRPVPLRPGELENSQTEILAPGRPSESLARGPVVLHWSASPRSFVVESLHAFPEENRLITTSRRLELV